MTQGPIATRRGTLLLAAGGLALPAFVAGRAAAQATPEAHMAATMAAGAFTSGVGQLGREKGESPSCGSSPSSRSARWPPWWRR